MPSSNFGASAAYTDAGPPEMISPLQSWGFARVEESFASASTGFLDFFCTHFVFVNGERAIERARRGRRCTEGITLLVAFSLNFVWSNIQGKQFCINVQFSHLFGAIKSIGTRSKKRKEEWRIKYQAT